MRVAVYGTLRKGGVNNSLLNGCRYLGRTTVQGYLFDFGPFPFFLRNHPTLSPTSVAVELFEIDKEKVKELDRLEGYIPGDLSRSLYRRTLIRPDGYQLPCLIYEWNRGFMPTQPQILSGDWFKR